MWCINKFSFLRESNNRVMYTGFTAYLLSDECDVFDKDDNCVCQDMTQALSHYFIASSHNTYVSSSFNRFHWFNDTIVRMTILMF